VRCGGVAARRCASSPVSVSVLAVLLRLSPGSVDGVVFLLRLLHTGGARVDSVGVDLHPLVADLLLLRLVLVARFADAPEVKSPPNLIIVSF
jgi:hypothetical protein